MFIAKKIIKFLNKIIDTGLLIFFLLFFLIGFYALYDYYMVYKQANDESILKYKPGYESDSDTDKEITDDMVAWLTLDDTSIDYPVMQGEDNTGYLNTDPFGEYSLSGSIFLDSRNTADFSDDYSLIYGHHMESDAMFGGLDHFLDKEYFTSHKTGILTVGDTIYQLTIFAVLESEATQENIFAPTEVEFSDTMTFIKENALYLDEDIFNTADQIIGMSTCKYPDTAERTIIFAKVSQ